MKKATDKIHQEQALPNLEDEDRQTLMIHATAQPVRNEQATGPCMK